MHSSDIHAWDWYRILIGEVPAIFLVEVILRVGVVFILLMASMRMLGKRMAGQLTRDEIAAMVAFASAIGVPMLSPDRGLLPAIIISVLVILLSRLNIYWTARNPKYEALFLGSIARLVLNGVLDLDAMTRTRISRERLFAELRSNNIKTLGEVKGLYLEANGRFTLLKSRSSSPGLSIIPASDPEFLRSLVKSGALVCHACGTVIKERNSRSTCACCGHQEWEDAVG